MKVLWGPNEFTDCIALLQWHNEIVLRVSAGPVRIDLRTPRGLPSQVTLEIRANQLVVPQGHPATVSATPQGVAVFWNEVPILMAQQADESTVLLHTDLRPLGMNIFDDAAGLHIGASVLARTAYRGCSTAIALG